MPAPGEQGSLRIRMICMSVLPTGALCMVLLLPASMLAALALAAVAIADAHAIDLNARVLAVYGLAVLVRAQPAVPEANLRYGRIRVAIEASVGHR